MVDASKGRSEEFLKVRGQFKLGALVTEASHPATANLSEVAKQDTAAALKLLFDVEDDVIRKFREFVESGRAGEIKETILHSLKNVGRIFSTGCGSTGRLSILLDSVWRDFWRQQARKLGEASQAKDRLEALYAASYDKKASDLKSSIPK